jgi:hypothetical protein
VQNMSWYQVLKARHKMLIFVAFAPSWSGQVIITGTGSHPKYSTIISLVNFSIGLEFLTRFWIISA